MLQIIWPTHLDLYTCIIIARVSPLTPATGHEKNTKQELEKTKRRVCVDQQTKHCFNGKMLSCRQHGAAHISEV